MARVSAEFRLFLEEICCNLMRFEYADRYDITPEDVDIDGEVPLGPPDAYADVRVTVPGLAVDYLEVDWGYDRAHLIGSLQRKFAQASPTDGVTHTIKLVVDRDDYGPEWESVQREANAVLAPGFELEIFDEAAVLGSVKRWFGLELAAVDPDDHNTLRHAMDDAKGRYAFGEEYEASPRQAALMWHFGFWRLAQLREAGQLGGEALIAPGSYQDVAVVFTDMSGFSGFVRDSADERVTRNALMAYYTKVRYQTLNMGGMLDQFLGDGSISLFGIPESRPDDTTRAFDCAKALLDVGRSVGAEWQRRIDRVQPHQGVHIGMALGDMQIMSLRPFGQTRTSIIGDSINLAGRLNGEAGPGEIVASNTFYQRLTTADQAEFEQLEPIDAKNVGLVNAWRRPAVTGR